MNMEINGQVAIVTGAGSGIGLEIVKQLLDDGVRVVFNDIAPALVQEVMEEINNPNLIGLAGDAGDLDFIQTLVQKTRTDFGRLDICVCNAGITSYGAFLDFTPGDFQQLIQLNLQGSFFLAQAAARQMIKQQSSGRILFMSSVTGMLAFPHLAAYGMTKAALSMLAKALVIELAPHGITTNAIAPGAVVTERTVAMDPNYGKQWGSITPTGRVSTPNDVAQTVRFLVSPGAQQINGQLITVDGGVTRMGSIPTDMDQV